MANIKLETVRETWDDFAAKVLPHLSPGEPQYEDMKASFYTGAFALFMNCNQLAHPSITEDIGEAYLSTINDEMMEFLRVAKQRQVERN